MKTSQIAAATADIGSVKGWLTKRPNGLFLVSYLPPAIARIGTTTDLDAFIAVGDGFGQHKVPPSTIEDLFGVEALSVEEIRPTRIRIASPGDLKCYVSRRGDVHGRQCMMTELKPVLCDRDGDLWPVHGDRLYCNDFCTWFSQTVWGVVPEVGQTVEASVRGEIYNIGK